MRIHSNILTPADLYRAIRAIPEGSGQIMLDFVTEHRSTKRTRGLEFRLHATPGRDYAGKARRPRNSGRYGAEYDKAATYDEHGQFFAALFRIDPSAIIGPYDCDSNFHRMTQYRY